MHTTHGVSIRQGCKAVGLSESTYRYERRPKADEPIIEALAALVERHPSIGLIASRILWVSGKEH